MKNTNIEFFQNHLDIESKIEIIIDKVKQEIFTNSDNRIKQYGLLFQFISSNLKEINEMVNNDEDETPKIHVNYTQDLKKTKEEQLKIGLLNKIDEVSSNKVSSLSSLKIPNSKKDSIELNNSECINSHSHKYESKQRAYSKNKREERSRRIINNSKLSNNISSINSEHLKNIIEDSCVGKGYLSDEISSIKSHEEKATKRIHINNINNNFINNNKTSSNFQFNFYIKNDISKRRRMDNVPYCESNDSDKTKEKFPFNDNNLSIAHFTKNNKSELRAPNKVYSSVTPNKKEINIKEINKTINKSIELSKTPDIKNDGKCTLF